MYIFSEVSSDPHTFDITVTVEAGDEGKPGIVYMSMYLIIIPLEFIP